LAANPLGQPKQVFDDLQAQLAGVSVAGEQPEVNAGELVDS